ncbi:MAG: hypothetical protein LVS60_00540 [Nodosilinea sp. LVE1205-7]|jgi:hypothetical protein
MDIKKLEFVRLLDDALATAEQMKGGHHGDYQDVQLSHLISALQTIKSQVVSDQLETSRGTSTLGLARQVADWIDSLDSPLLKAVGIIEQYYQRHYSNS